MTPARPAGDDDACDDARNDDDDVREDAPSRRGLLRSGAAAALAFASAGCLSNPWSPGATRRETGTSDAGDDPAPAPATGTESTGGDGTTNDVGETTAESDSTATEVSTTAESDSTGTEASTTATATEVPAAEQEPDLVVEVAPDGFMFSPETFEISAGDTVHWEWKDSGHNVRVKESPGDSEWTGTPGDATDTYGEGYLHAHTFEASGKYEYYCAPHRSLGLRGSFTVR